VSVISHSRLHFYRHAIDVCLQWSDWREALRYADALEDYVRAEPLPWATLIIERGRALAALVAGKPREPVFSELRRIRDELSRARMHSSLSDSDAVLNSR
jgi:hypothetical protein